MASASETVHDASSTWAVCLSTTRNARWLGDSVTWFVDDEDSYSEARSEKGKAVRLKHFEHGESSGCHEHASHPAPKWDVVCFVKMGHSIHWRHRYGGLTYVV